MLRDQRPPMVLVQDQTRPGYAGGAATSGVATVKDEAKPTTTAAPASPGLAGKPATKGNGPAADAGMNGAATETKADEGKAAKARTAGADQGLKAPSPIETTVKTPTTVN
jgi:hypothetical protein